MTQAHFTRSRPSILLALTFAFVIAGGCSVVPVQEMSDARQAVAAAQASGDSATNPSLQEARAALAQAEIALKNVQYRRARDLAVQARTKAIEAQQAAGATK